MKEHCLDLCLGDPLSCLIESARQNPKKNAIRRLKRAQRTIKREIRRLRKQRKHSGKHPDRSPETWETPSTPVSRRVQVLNARPGVLEAGNLPGGGFHFCPPDPSVVHELLIPAASGKANGGAEPPEDVPVPVVTDAMDGDDVLVLAPGEKSET